VDIIDENILKLSKGNSMMGDWEVLFQIVKNIAVKIIVEIGTAYGTSAMVLSRGGAEVHTIDNYKIYNNPRMYKMIRYYLYLYSKGNIHAYKNDSVKIADVWLNESINLLYIDGGHSYEQVKADYRAWYSKVKKNCLILFHDVNKKCPGVLKFHDTDLQEEIKKGKIEELIFNTRYETVIKGFIKR
jgi:predicted O-methyltransferase YrrM